MLDSIQINPVAFTIPGIDLDIYWYGILIAIGIAIGAFWAARELEKRGQSVDDFFTGLIIVIVVGYISARLWYVLQDMIGNNATYTFVEAINIRAGGVNILGGFIGALIAAWLFVRWRKLDFWQYADVAGPAVLIAQAIGRWANFINQELYGPPTDAPWGILIDFQNRLPEYVNLSPEQRFHPTFLYESILLFLDSRPDHTQSPLPRQMGRRNIVRHFPDCKRDALLSNLWHHPITNSAIRRLPTQWLFHWVWLSPAS
ncbi:MAG: prolipoprotein diacylglyceryl transferase [Anaerolineae bacterium]|nr:prolipoprotein diacylglyceryl transferase [Anaerolineae bacterium]